MKCISIWQPWASLLFSPGQFRKEFETRPLVKRGQNWYPSIVLKPGERVAIQAAKTMAGIEIACEEISREDRHFMAESLLQQFGNIGWDKLPRGCILGTVEIGTTFVVENINADLSPRERAFGHYGEREACGDSDFESDPICKADPASRPARGLHR